MDPSPAVEPLTAVVLAAGGGDLARRGGVVAKALLPLAGKAMGRWVVDALRGSRAVTEIVWVGPRDAALEASVDVVVAGGTRLVDSLALGLGAALGRRPGTRLLIASADIPWLRPGDVDRFVATAPDADLVYPAVRESTYRERFPDHARTFVRFAEGRFTGGNLMLLRPDAVAPLLPFAERAYRARKNPLALAAMVGPGVVLAVLVGRASVRRLERRASALLGVEARALLDAHPHLAADVDRSEHLVAAATLAGNAS